MDDRIDQLAALATRQHGVFARRQAAALAVYRETVRNGIDRGRWSAESAQVLRMAGVHRGAATRAMAAVLDCGPGAVLSHTAAAWLHRLPGFAPEPLHVTSSARTRSRLAIVHSSIIDPKQVAGLGAENEVAGRVDCYFREARLVVELDGRAYHSAALDRLEDGRRDLVLLRSGRRVLRLTWQHVVERPLEVVTALREVLACAA